MVRSFEFIVNLANDRPEVELRMKNVEIGGLNYDNVGENHRGFVGDG